MVDQIVAFISQAAAAAVNLAISMFDSMGMWGIVFAGISTILICRFILGPILGVSFSAGASDTASKPKGRGKGYKVSQGHASSADSAAMRQAGFRSGGDL